MLLRRFDRWLKTLFLLNLRSPGWARAIALAALCAGVAGTLQLRQTGDAEEQLDESLVTAKDLREMRRSFPLDSNSGLILLPENGKTFSAGELCDFRSGVYRDLRDDPAVESMSSAWDLRKARYESSKLYFDRVLADPCALPRSAPYSLEGARKGAWGGIWVPGEAASSNDFITFLKFARLDPPGRSGAVNMDELRSWEERAKSALGNRHLWMGPEFRTFFTLNGMAQDSKLDFLILLLLAVFLRAICGRWRSGAIFTGTVALNAILVFGGMGIFRQSVDPISSCIFVMITVSSLEDFVFLSQLKRDGSRRGIRSYLRMVTPSFFTSFTTVIGFGSLALSSIGSIVRFGSWCAAGAFLEWAILFFLLAPMELRWPALHWCCPRKQWLTPLWNSLSRVRLPRWAALTSCVLVFTGAAAAIPHLDLSQDPSAIFPPRHPFQRSIDHLKLSRQWIGQAYLLFDTSLSPKSGEARKKAILTEMARAPHVQRLVRYTNLLDETTRSLPTSAGGGLRDLVERDSRATNAYQQYFSSLGEERVVVYLDTSNTERINELRRRVERICPNGECRLIGESVAFSDFSRKFIDTLFSSLFASLLLVGGVLAFLFLQSGVKGIGWVWIASIWGPAFMIGLIALLGYTVNSVTCIVASVVVGLTGDNAVQFLFAARHSSGAKLLRGATKMGNASLQTASTVAGAMAVILASYFEPVRELGILLIAGILTSAIGDLWILKGMISSGKRAETGKTAHF